MYTHTHHQKIYFNLKNKDGPFIAPISFLRLKLCDVCAHSLIDGPFFVPYIGLNPPFMYTKSKFEKELTYNRGEIKKHADRLRIDFSQQQVSQKEQAESWAESDYETRIALSTDPNFGLRTISDESRPFYSAIPSPYFLHTKDGNSYSYISNDITFSNILKYTTARASYLRYNGEERQYLEIDGDIINVSIDTNNQIEES